MLNAIVRSITIAGVAVLGAAVCMPTSAEAQATAPAPVAPATAPAPVAPATDPASAAPVTDPATVDPAQLREQNRLLNKISRFQLYFSVDRGLRGYACVATPGSNASAIRSVRILVTSRSAARYARRRARDAKLGSIAKVLRTSPRYGALSIGRLRGTLLKARNAGLPEGERRLVAIGYESNDQASRCPRITITLFEEASEETAGWAAEQVDRYGCDRVVTSRAQPGTYIPL